MRTSTTATPRRTHTKPFRLPLLSFAFRGSTRGAKINKDADGGQGVGKTRLAEHGKSDANTSGIILRAAVVQAETRLHGKPASSFFARAHTTSAAAILKTTPEDVPEGTLADGSYLEKEKASTGTELSVAAAFKGHTPTQYLAGKENQASSLRGSTSTASNPDTLGAVSFTDVSTNSRSEGVKGIRTINKLRGRSTRRRPGLAGTKRRGKGEDSWTTSTAAARACSLDGELVLLDGILHDPKTKTWMEASLAPEKVFVRSLGSASCAGDFSLHTTRWETIYESQSQGRYRCRSRCKSLISLSVFFAGSNGYLARKHAHLAVDREAYDTSMLHASFCVIPSYPFPGEHFLRG